MRVIAWFFLVLLTASSTSVWANDGPVVLVKTLKKQFLSEPYDEIIGRVEPVEKVNITSRVPGLLEKRLFNEGDKVKKGQPLFQIEQTHFQLQVEQKQASLMAAEALLKEAQTKLIRTKKLGQSQVVSEADLDVAEADRDKLAADLMQSQVELKEAKLELAYTTIHSPISGMTGKSPIDPGNFINTNKDLLVTIINSDEVYVDIAVSDRILLKIRKTGEVTDDVFPRLQLSDGSVYQYDGIFTFVDPQVNRQTDTTLIRSKFPNPEHILVPGQFVKVQITPKQTTAVLTVPQAAVQRDRHGPFVMLVNDNDQAIQQRITLGEQIRGNWLVLSGLAEGDRVIVEGLQKIKSGLTVKAQEMQK